MSQAANSVWNSNGHSPCQDTAPSYTKNGATPFVTARACTLSAEWKKGGKSLISLQAGAIRMSTEPAAADEHVASGDTESPKEIVSSPEEAQKETTSEPDNPPSNPSPADDEGPPDVPSSGAASPEPLLGKEDDAPEEAPGPGADESSEKAPGMVLANPVFDEKVKAKIELKEVVTDEVTSSVKKEGEVVEQE